jgi:hypothetical protein
MRDVFIVPGSVPFRRPAMWFVCDQDRSQLLPPTQTLQMTTHPSQSPLQLRYNLRTAADWLLVALTERYPTQKLVLIAEPPFWSFSTSPRYL